MELTIFKRMNCNGTPINSWTIAAWHWDWSLTWRWTINWSPWYKPPGKQGVSFRRVYKSVNGFNFHAGLNLPIIGHFTINTQPNMKK